MKRLSILLPLLVALFLNALAGASTITGTVKNGTTSKPSIGEGLTEQFTATGTYSNGGTQDITS